MTSAAPSTLWHTEDRKYFFLVPDDATLPLGKARLFTGSGRTATFRPLISDVSLSSLR